MNEKSKLNNLILNKTKESLLKNFFEAKIINNKDDIINELHQLINKNDIIGYGGSKSLDEIGFFNHFNKKNYPNLLDRNDPNLTPEEKKELQNKALTADVFLCSANALSQTGELILIDKWGNRNGAMTYGPKKRIFITGVNKIVLTLNEAIERAKNEASVLNNIRFDTKNPCTINGRCMDCNSTSRICSITTIIHRCQPPKSIVILLVDETLGF